MNPISKFGFVSQANHQKKERKSKVISIQVLWAQDWRLEAFFFCSDMIESSSQNHIIDDRSFLCLLSIRTFHWSQKRKRFQWRNPLAKKGED